MSWNFFLYYSEITYTNSMKTLFLKMKNRIQRKNVFYKKCQMVIEYMPDYYWRVCALNGEVNRGKMSAITSESRFFCDCMILKYY